MNSAEAAPSAQGIRHWFEELASVLEHSRDRALRARAVVCVVEVQGEGGGIWTINLRADPPRVQPGDTPGAECRIQVSSKDFLLLCQDPSQRDFLVWTGRLKMIGAGVNLSWINRLLFRAREEAANPIAGYYRALARLLPDQRFVFMNHGYCDGTEDFGELRSEDQLWRYSIQLVRHLLSGLDLRGQRVLDVGCGRGGASSYIARYHQPAQVVSLDFCGEAIHLCARTHRIPGLSFLQANAQKLPLASGRFDVVLNIESCHCYPDPAGFLTEVARVLKPGGFLCITDSMPANDLARFEKLIPGAGFEIVRSTDITSEVAEGIHRNRQQLADLCSSMVSPEIGNRGIIEQLLRSVNEDIYRAYLKRLAIYHSWLLRKP
jgi:ubiquinone/menaquinone biosynthesis C-methylase UbiE